MVMEENGTADYAQFMRRDIERFSAIVRSLNLQVK